MSENTKLLITNNPKVKEAYEKQGKKLDYELDFCDKKADVFIKARNRIHKGWQLLNHTMAGNIPLYKHPYRSLALKKIDSLDTCSLDLIERAIEQLSRAEQPHYSESVLNDFQDLDFAIFSEVKI